MIHLGDITKINGSLIPPVDVIIGGSPCQDLSIAGNRKGLQGERSGLFMEQLRIIKEMRNTYGTDYPRFMVWENVPGALSSNGGEDFRAVLEETIRIIRPGAVIPRPEKWRTSGCIMGNGWSLAWRILDAQFWGVPQRRRRISLIADFGGNAAPEILFIRKGVSGDHQKSRPQRERIAPDVKRGPGETIAVFDGRGNGDGETVPTMTGDHNDRITDYTALIMAHGQANAEIVEGMSPTLNCNHEQPIVCMATQQGGAEIRTDDSAPTLTAAAGMSGNNQPIIALGRDFISGGEKNHGMAINTDEYAFAIQGNGPGGIAAVDCRNGVENPGVNGTLQAKPTCGSSVNLNNTVRVNQAVRRLTPLECERLQGYPDGWTDIGEWMDGKGKKHKTTDAPRYKALGNSIALPPWKWLLKRISSLYERDATMGSLFDGIGGFPLIWEQLNGKGSCSWASEIEEFCIAVTEKRFGK